MTIKEVEELTGITKQNIRFYEKKGLLFPDRNKENDYRCYSQQDVERLQIIKMMRKLDMPVEEIKSILEGRISIPEAASTHRERLQCEKKRLQAAITVCEEIQKLEADSVDVNCYLKKMEEIEKTGGRFMSILEDYKRVSQAESAKKFSFVPDTMCMDPAEFSQALFTYADAQGLNLVITKEGMYPEFEIDGIPYTADRVWGRYGAIVRCKVMNEDDLEVWDIPKERRKKLKFAKVLVGILPVCIIAAIITQMNLLLFAATLAWFWGVYYVYGGLRN